MSLTNKQRQFVQEYLTDLNATQAAIRAGYSASAANREGARLLAKPRVAEAIAEAMKARSERTQITADMVLRELARIGFSDIRNVVQWGGAVVVKDPDTGGEKISNGVALVDSAAIDDETAASIAEVSQTKDGTLKVKLHDKRAALVDIGRHLGMFTDNVNITGSISLSELQALADAYDEQKRRHDAPPPSLN